MTATPTPAPADRPSFKIKTNGAAVSAEYPVASIVVTRAFNRVASAEILLFDGDAAAADFRASNAAEFVPGAEIEILAGYHGNEESIFKGLVVRHGVRVHPRKGSMLRVECRDAAVKLTVGRKSAYFYDSTDSDIIQQIASAVSLQTDVESTSVTHGQMVQYRATDWDFVVTRAEANGKLVSTRDGKLEVKAPSTAGNPVLSLAFGGNLLEFEAVADARWQYAAVKGATWSPADQSLLEAEGASPSASTPGNLSSDDLAGVLGLESLELRASAQLKDTELQAWADAERLRGTVSKVRGRARVQGYATIAPGDVVELSGVGERFNGKALVSGVRHEIDRRNWETDIAFGLDHEPFACAERGVAQPPADGLLPPIAGLQIGLVTALEGDPDGEERIQVRVPAIGIGEDGTWARLASLDAGENRGAVFRPEIGDEVILGFLNDDPRNPVVLGMLYSSAKPAPIPAADDNPQKGFVTRGEIQLVFDDDKKVLVLATPNGNTLVLSDEDGGLRLEDENGNKIVLDANGITLESAADFAVKASSGDAKIDATNVELTASAQLKGEGSAGAEINSSANTVIKGSLVQIN